ncbi:MAG: hypothetical protein R3B11_00700 [Nitrospira sp.]|nr:hypothetical protein [Nitrospira sp.]MDR4474512.1 hypothetical protein [Nitrospira sp.]
MIDNRQHRDPRLSTSRFLQEFATASLFSLSAFGMALSIAWPVSAHAEIRVVKASGEHRMTDRETRVDAIRLAGEQAKKEALEQVASYLESVTVVRDLDVTRDELRSYTAGMVLVLDQQIDTRLDGDVVVIRVDLKTQVNTDQVAQALATLKQQETVREELLALKADVDHLQQQLGEANRALAQAHSPEQSRQLNQQRANLLDQAESHAMVAQAWTDWLLIAPFAQPYPTAGLAHVQALLGLASRLNPDNPHLASARRMVAANTAPPPPQPRQPPVPHTVPFLPGYSVVPQQPAPPVTTPSPESRQPSGVSQLNPLRPDPSGEPLQPGKSTTIFQAQPQPGTAPPTVTRGRMPTYRQVPAPNSQPGQPTLHTYRAGGATGAPGGSAPQGPTTGGIHPPSPPQSGPPGLTPPGSAPRTNDQGGQ